MKRKISFVVKSSNILNFAISEKCHDIKIFESELIDFITIKSAIILCILDVIIITQIL